MATSIGEIEATLRLRDQMSRQLAQASAAVDQFVSKTARAGQNLDKIGSAAIGAGTALTAGFTVPITAAFVALVKSSSDFETAFANARKTIGNVPEIEEIREDLRGLSRELPQSAARLAEFAALGGQFGISAKGIAEFTKTVAALDVAVDSLSGELAAEGIAQIRNITGEAEKDVGKLASTLVALGNAGASSEQQILDFAQRLSGTGKAVGLMTHEIFGLGATLANLGINAELGSTAISRTMTDMQIAVATGGREFDAFARVAKEAGLEADEFANTFRDKPIKAIEAFITGLGNIKQSGGDVIAALQGLDIEAIRQFSTLLQLASASGNLAAAQGQVAENVRIAGEAYDKANEHLEAAARKNDTFVNQLARLRNILADVLRPLGDSLVNALKDLIDAFRVIVPLIEPLVAGFIALPSPVKLAAVAILGLTALAGPLTLLFGLMLKGIGDAVTGLGVLSAAYVRATTAARGFAVAQGGAAATSGAMGTMAVSASRLSSVLFGATGLIAGLGALALAYAELKIGGIRAQAEEFETAAKILGRSAKDIDEARRAIKAFQDAGGSTALFGSGGEPQPNKNAIRDPKNAPSLVDAQAIAAAIEQQRRLKEQVEAAAKATDMHDAAMKGATITLQGFGTAAAKALVKQPVTDFVGELAAMDAKLAGLLPKEKAQIEAARALGANMALVAKEYGLTEEHLDRLTETTKAGTKAFKDTKAAAERGAEAIRKIFDAAVDAERESNKLSDTFAKMGAEFREFGVDVATDLLEKQMRVLDEATEAWAEYQKFVREAMALDDQRNVEGEQESAFLAFPQKLVDPFMDAFTEFGKQLPNIIFGTLASGGSMVGAIASGLAVEFGRKFQEALKEAGGKFKDLKAGGKALGIGAVGLSSFIGGFGIGESSGSKTKGALGGAAAGALAGLPLAGPTLGLSVAVGALAGALGGLFGAGKKAKEELQKLRQAQQDLIKDFGGIDKLREAADGVGISIGNALTTKKGPEFERFVAKLNDLIKAQADKWQTIAPLIGDIQQLGGRLPAAFQGYIDQLSKAKLLSSENLDVMRQLTGEGEVDWQRLQEVAEKYGISLSGLGERFQAAKLSAGAQQLWDDFQMLVGAGADTTAVLDGMSDEISNLVINSMKFGVAIPENFRKLVEQLMLSGKLLDENGEKILDLSNLKFSDTIQTSIEKLVDKLDEFLTKLLEVPGAIAKIPPVIDIAVNVERNFNSENLDGVMQLASGGIVTRPTLAVIGESGPEAVVPLNQSGFAQQQPQTIIVQSILDGRIISESVARHLPSTLLRMGA